MLVFLVAPFFRKSELEIETSAVERLSLVGIGSFKFPKYAYAGRVAPSI